MFVVLMLGMVLPQVKEVLQIQLIYCRLRKHNISKVYAVNFYLSCRA